MKDKLQQRLVRIAGRRSSALLLYVSLLAIPLVDEAAGGFDVLVMPLIRADLSFHYGQVGLLFSVAMATGLVVDPIVSAVSDHWPKKPLIIGSMFGLAAGMALVGVSHSYSALLFAYAVMGATNGAAVSLPQLVLIDRSPGGEVRVMTRWTLTSAVGDLISPLVVTLVIAWQMGWRLLFGGAALIWTTVALVLLPQRFEKNMPARRENRSPLSLRAIGSNLVAAARTPLLLRWIVLDILPTLLDEMFLVFAGLFLVDRVGLQPAVVTATLSAPIAAGLIGLLLLERYGSRIRPQRLLTWSSLLVLAGLALFVSTQSLAQAVVGLALIGFGASSWYPVTQGMAFATLPGRPGAVRALGTLIAPLEIAAPWLIGLAAQRWGVQVGVSLLMAAPIAMVVLMPRRTAALPPTEPHTEPP